MKKLLTILLILSTGLTYGQAIPCHSVCQTNAQRAFMKQSLDSAKKVWKIEFLNDATKADEALISKLPVFRKGTLDSLDKLNIYLKQVTTPAVDTSWKATIAAQQVTITAQAKLITDLAAQLSELKLWADRMKLKEYIINFK